MFRNLLKTPERDIILMVSFGIEALYSTLMVLGVSFFESFQRQIFTVWIFSVGLMGMSYYFYHKSRLDKNKDISN